MLSPKDGSNAPIFDGEARLRTLAVEIDRVSSQAFGQMTRPIGLRADYMEMYLDDQYIARIDRRIREWEITEAVSVLRDRLRSGASC